MQTSLVLVTGFPELAAVLTPLRFRGPHDLMELPSVVVLPVLSVVDACALTAGHDQRQGAQRGDGEKAAGQQEPPAPCASYLPPPCVRHVYFRKKRQLKRPIQTMSTKCQ